MTTTGVPIDGPGLLGRWLEPRADRLLRIAGEAAAGKGARLYLVGGAVRDMLRGVEHLDLDLVVVGDLGSVLDEIQRREGGEVVCFPRFSTATYRHPDLRVDLAASRRESYSRPGARPTVTVPHPGLDLERRDYSVNAMALDLAPERWGEATDPFGGAADLASGQLRILHPGSFLDDPTRILRGIRYQVRMGFRMEAGTLTCLESALEGRCLSTLDPDRLFSELRATLGLGSETDEAVRWMERYRLLESLDPELAPVPGDATRVSRLARIFEALEDAGARVKDPAMAWVYLLLARTPSRLSRSRWLVPMPGRWIEKFEAAHLDPRPPFPGMRGGMGPAEAALRLLAQDSNDEDFAHGLGILVSEYGAGPPR